MAVIASWSGDGLDPDSTWTGETGSGDVLAPAITRTGGSAVVSQNTITPPNRNTGVTLRLDHVINQYCYVSWTNPGGVISQNSGRVYFRTEAAIAGGDPYPLSFYSGSTRIAYLRWAASAPNYLRLYQGDGTLQDTSTVSLSTSTWYRIEWRVDSSLNVEFRFYDIASSETSEVSALTLTGTLDAGFSKLVLGYNTTAQAQPDFWWDDLLWTDTYEFLGPYSTTTNNSTTTTKPTAPAFTALEPSRAITNNVSTTTTAPTASFGTQQAIGLVEGDNATTTTRPTAAFTAQQATGHMAISVTTTAPTVAFDPGDPIFGAQQIENGASYQDGIGHAAGRYFNLFYPYGTAPAAGWPLMVYMHGGGFNSGSRNLLPSRILNKLVELGWAVASIDYEMTTFDMIFNTNTGATHPEPVSDALCALKYITNTYDIDPGQVAVMGMSAGGHLALEAALTTNDSTNYTWGFERSAPNWRQDAEPQTRPNFRYDQGGRTGVPNILGAFLIAGPVNCEWLYTYGWGDTIWTPSWTASMASRTYGGGLPNTAYPLADTKEELNLDALIEGRTGSVYEGHSHVPDFPIAYVEGTSDDVVPADGGITPLTAALDVVNYDTSSNINTVNPNGGLSHFQLVAEHETVEGAFDIQYLVDWIDSLSVDVSTTTTAPTVAFTPGTNLPTHRRVTTTAPTASFTAQTATGVNSSNITTTTTAPEALFAARQVTGTNVGNVSTTTTAPTLAIATPTATGLVGGSNATTTIRPTVTFATPSATGAVVGNQAVTTTAPGVAFTPQQAQGSGNRAYTTTAPTAEFTAITPAVRSGIGTITSRPTASFTAHTPSGHTETFATTTAPAITFIPHTPAVTSGISVTTEAPSVIFTVHLASGSGTGQVSVTTTAPTVAFHAPTLFDLANVPVVGNIRTVALKTYVRKRNKMTTLELSSVTEEYVDITFVSREDPTAHPVEFAMLATGVKPAETDWYAGEWVGDSELRVSKWFTTARVLVGSTDFPLTDGTYQLWMRVRSASDNPVKKAGLLKVT